MFENIGKGDYTIPGDCGPPLSDLLKGEALRMKTDHGFWGGAGCGSVEGGEGHSSLWGLESSWVQEGLTPTPIPCREIVPVWTACWVILFCIPQPVQQMVLSVHTMAGKMWTGGWEPQLAASGLAVVSLEETVYDQ